MTCRNPGNFKAVDLMSIKKKSVSFVDSCQLNGAVIVE